MKERETLEEDRLPVVEQLVDDIVSGRGLTLYFDNDGTVFPFVQDPKDVKIDPACYEALVRLAHLPNVEAFSLTGRDVHEARDLMLTPGLKVTDSRGAVLSEEGRRTLHFRIIGSHGVECLMVDKEDGSVGELIRHAFSETEQSFINRFQAKAQEFRRRYPTLTVEMKHGAVGVNAGTLNGMSEKEKNAVLEAALTAINEIVDGDTAPQTPHGENIFALCKEGPCEFEVRPVRYGKDFGIRRFGNLKSGRRTLFLCDSLGQEGTDRPAAELVNSLEKGSVFMVLNGRNAPPEPGSPQAPHRVFESPAHLGRFLNAVAESAESKLFPQRICTRFLLPARRIEP